MATSPRTILGAIAALGVLGCAGGQPETAKLSPEEARAERLRLQVSSLRSEIDRQARLDNVAYPLLRSGVELCGNEVAYRPGFRALSLAAYPRDVADAARQLGISDTLRVAVVTRGAAADRAGLRAGDVILEVAGKPAPVGRNAMRDFAEYLRKLPQNDQSFVSLVVRSDSSTAPRAIAIPQEQLCSYGAVSVGDDALNAWTDADNIYVTSALQRYTKTDEELAIVVGHELAHGALNHLGTRKRNSTIGAILGAAVDIAASSNGVYTQGAGQAIGGGAGNRAFSQEFERDADYVGMYLLARAGVSYDNVGTLWRRMAEAKPGSIQFAATHGPSADRFTRIDQAAREIDRKKSANQPLLPNSRK